MQITDLQIDHYGVWRQLALPLQKAGLNVFYGPNEAGKTTLLKFIRNVLYGTEQTGEDGRGKTAAFDWDGSLRIAEGDRFCTIRRWSQAGEAGLEFQELDPASAWRSEPDWDGDRYRNRHSAFSEGPAAEAALQGLLPRADARLFRHVFAIGLKELQVLATLHDEEVAREIYALSLGAEGRKLLKVTQELNEARGFPPSQIEQIAKWIERDAELNHELEQFADFRERHHELSEEYKEHAARLEELDRREIGLRQQLRGHESLKRVWEPWNQVREYEAQLNTLPPAAMVAGIDPGRLRALETEIRELAGQRKTLIAEVRQIRQQLRSSGNQRGQQLAAEMQGFLHQRDWLAHMERDVETANARDRELKAEFEARQQVLGPEWPVHRLSAIDTRRAAYVRLVDGANAFQTAQRRQSSLRKRYEKLASACHQQQADWDQHIEALPEGSLEEALDATRPQIVQVKELARLKQQERELKQSFARSAQDPAARSEPSHMPGWVPGFLLFLAGSGLVLSVLGFYTGLTSNGIAGAILGLVGLAGFAIARAFKLHAEAGVRKADNEQQTAIRNQETKLEELQSAIQDLTQQAWAVPVSEVELANERAETILENKLSERLAELERLENRQRRIRFRKRRLSRMRKAMQTRGRELAQAREAWCDALKQCGLGETVQAQGALKLWQNVAEAKEQLQAWDAAREAAADVMERYESFCHRMADLGQRTGHPHLDYNQPLAVLDVWEHDVNTLAAESEEQQIWKQEAHDRRRELRRLQKQITKARMARVALLARVGAKNRKGFEDRLAAASRRRELEELLVLAREELAAVSQLDPELAIVEEDLAGFDSEQNQESIDLLKMELDDLQTERTETSNHLESIQEEQATLEMDPRPKALRAERIEIAGRLRQCLEQQAAMKLAAKTAKAIRGEFERTCQPEILSVASDYLAQLTCGKYSKVWTKLDEQRLLVRKDDRPAFSVEELSTGTREQLFLALRLGLVHEFAQRGIRLPMVLDDVLVNFDQHRTEAAVETLMEFAERGHQVLLLTSHLHVARFAEGRGIDIVWLEAHHAPVERRRAG